MSNQKKDNASVIIIDILKHAVSKKASDIFIAPNFPPAIKVDGKITPISSQALTPQHSRELVRAVMTERQAEEFDRTSEANFAINPAGLGRFRVNVYREQGRIGMVLRKITTEIPTIDQLQLQPILKDLAIARRGLIIFVGATGSGKSTSLAAMIDWRNSNVQDHIITVEDPIEFVHQHKKSIITQREIGVDTENWESALTNSLRQAPDAILIGEIRDKETMMSAMQFAETGHLCLSTLHATNANQALDRIINFFPEERHAQVWMDLALNLKGIISQRLVPKAALPGKKSSGRVAALEIMLNSPLIQDLIFKGRVGEIKDVIARSNDIGMQTFDQHLFNLYSAGIIGYEDAMRNADSMNDLRLRIKLAKDGNVAKDILDDDAHLNLEM
ncbi:PilT/PilU family type 4a pilus ATPase [Neisseria sp. Ec49-e6-T10]|uniref:PilT/PilU family type 4a pilus ATPase n=1 Tax=Neisseria sp. Ec49-e6-T10 TaxID=3140744 RepID=UPI003EB98110